MRASVDRRRGDILALQCDGISTADAELVLGRLIGERNGLVAAQPSPMQGKMLGGRKWS